MAQTKVSWKNDDPLSDRGASLGAQKGFKGAKFQKSEFPDRAQRQEIDEFYRPHKGKERQ